MGFGSWVWSNSIDFWYEQVRIQLYCQSSKTVKFFHFGTIPSDLHRPCPTVSFCLADDLQLIISFSDLPLRPRKAQLNQSWRLQSRGRIFFIWERFVSRLLLRCILEMCCWNWSDLFGRRWRSCWSLWDLPRSLPASDSVVCSKR